MEVEKDLFFCGIMNCRNGGARLAPHDALLEVQPS